MLDPSSSTLYVAFVGDYRAVLPRKDADAGPEAWNSIPLSTDQTGFSEAEKERIAREHPGETPTDPETGRLLGFQITRAFGDAYMKWPVQALDDCNARFFGEKKHKNCLTPLYMTAEPVIFTTKILKGDVLILRSDGFWNHTKNEDAVLSASQWVAANGQDENLPGTETADMLKDVVDVNESDVTGDVDECDGRGDVDECDGRRDVDENDGTGDVDENDGRGDADENDLDGRGDVDESDGTSLTGYPYMWVLFNTDYVVKDDNMATHLVKNAFGGRVQDLFRAVMSVSPPYNEHVIDDTTVIAVQF